MSKALDLALLRATTADLPSLQLWLLIGSIIDRNYRLDPNQKSRVFIYQTKTFANCMFTKLNPKTQIEIRNQDQHEISLYQQANC